MAQNIKNILIENEYLNQLTLDLETENKELKEEITLFKARLRELSKRNLELESEIADLKFTRNYLTSEEAGHRFAQELLGGI